MDEAPVEGVESAGPSLKALGKRRALDDPPNGPAPVLLPPDLATGPARPPKQVQAVTKSEKRVTRSSLGGSGNGSEVDKTEDPSSPPIYLPKQTPILLTLQRPPEAVFFPPLGQEELVAGSSASLSESSPAGPHVPTPLVPFNQPTVPDFRLLGLEDSFSRSRHGGMTEQQDTSDAFYLRLHRYPEVLEKRSAKLERDRLIHERSKLILELEDLRGRGWVYHGGARVGRSEEIRRRKIREGEERLKRYDALLPNQPRKSGSLNLGSHLNDNSNASIKSRSNSPLPPAPSTATAPSSSHSRTRESVRHSTPVSASGDGGTTIRIKFGQTQQGQSSQGQQQRVVSSSSAAGGRLVSAGPPHANGAPESSGDGSTKRKRDRRLEKERSEERKRLGLGPRDSLPGDIGANGAGEPQRKKKKKKRSNPEMDRDSQDERNMSDGNDEEDEEDEYDGMDEEGRLRQQMYAAQRRLRLPDSFFSSEALRDSVAAMANSKSGRRSSGRVMYAFGTRLPDQALANRYDFELRGGQDESDYEDEMNLPLEEMVRKRLGDHTVMINGIPIPPSALEVLANGPLQWNPTANLPLQTDLSASSSGLTTPTFSPPPPSRTITIQPVSPVRSPLGVVAPVTVQNEMEEKSGSPPTFAPPPPPATWARPSPSQQPISYAPAPAIAPFAVPLHSHTHGTRNGGSGPKVTSIVARNSLEVKQVEEFE
ncbi:hypothetical protein T439DRAFT_376873 [Meredithblackwellia eburnea MCA 4105]